MVALDLPSSAVAAVWPNVERDKVLQEGGDGDRVSLDARKKLVLFTKQAALLAEQLKKLEADPSLADLCVACLRAFTWDLRIRRHAWLQD